MYTEWASHARGAAAPFGPSDHRAGRDRRARRRSAVLVDTALHGHTIFFCFFIFIFTYFINISYLKKIYTLKCIGKVRTLAPHILGRDANRGTHAHIHNYTGRDGARGGTASRRRSGNIHKYKL